MPNELDPRKLAEEIASLKKAVRDLQLSAQMAHTSVEGGPTEFYDDDDTLRAVVGLQDDGSYTARDLNAPPMLPPDYPFLSSTPGALVVSSFGLANDFSDYPYDFREIEVHVSYGPDFTPDDYTKWGTFPRGGGILTFALDAGTYYVKLVAVNTSGVSSEPSVEKSQVVSAVEVGAGGVKTYRTDTEPLGLTVDDDGALWYETDNGNLQHRWDGTDLIWVAMPYGSGAIDDNAIEERHVGDRQVRPGSIQTHLGGAFINMVNDPAFADSVLRTQRLAAVFETAGVDWSFDQNVNQFPTPCNPVPGSAYWTPGPLVTFSDDGFGRLQIDANGLIPGDATQVIAKATLPLPAFPAGKVLSFTIPKIGPVAEVTWGQTDIEYRFLDGGGAQIGPTVSFTEIPDSPTVALGYWDHAFALDALSAGAAEVEISYTIGDYPVPANPWTTTTGAFSLDSAVDAYLSLHGFDIADGEWFAQVEMDAGIVGTGSVFTMPLTDPFPVDPSNFYYHGADLQWEQVSGSKTTSAFLGTRLEFYDANGDPIGGYGDQIESGQQDDDLVENPVWDTEGVSVRPYTGAASARLFLAAAGFGGVARFKMKAPTLLVSGKVNMGDTQRTVLQPGVFHIGKGTREDRFPHATVATPDEVLFEARRRPDGSAVDMELSGDLTVGGVTADTADVGGLLTAGNLTTVGDANVGGDVNVDADANVTGTLTAAAVEAPIPFSSRYMSGALSTATSAWTELSFGTDTETTGIDWASPGAAGVWTITRAGIYLVNCSVLFQNNTTGRRLLRMMHNGVEVARTENEPPGSTDWGLAVTRPRRCAVGDTFHFEVYQSSGAALDIVAGEHANHAEFVYLGA